jgi:protein ImuB
MTMYACLHAAGNRDLLIECARRFSPRIEETSDDTVLFDVRGLGNLIGDAHTIARAMENHIGFPANIAVSVNADAAILAARGIRGVTVIAPGNEAQVLAPLPLNLLPGSPEAAGMLDAWGIRTLGQLAALPPLGVAARLGPKGTYLQHLAQGRADRQLRPIEEPLRFAEELDLEYPVELLEPLAFILGRLLHDVLERLSSRGLATDEMRLALMLENADPHRCTLRFPVPLSDARTLLKLLQLELSARPPCAAVLKVHLELNPVKPCVQQHGLFIAHAPEPAKLEVTLSRLSNLLGAENVGTPELLDTHRPDAFRIARFSATACRIDDSICPSEVLAFRRCRPPQIAQIRFIWETPAHIATASVKGRIVASAGPWRSSGDWWKRGPWDHAEWDVAVTDGAVYRIREDLRTGRWFLEGNYD